MTVLRILKRHDVPPRPSAARGWQDTEQARRKMVTAYQSGLSVINTAKRFHTSARKVQRVLDDAGQHRHPGGKRRYTADEPAEFARLYRSGASLQDIATQFGTNAITISGYLRREGVQLRPLGAPAFWTEERKAEAARRYAEGEHIKDIAAAMGCGIDTASRTLIEMGVHQPRNWTLRGPAHHSWQGGRIIDGQGYVRVKVPDVDRPLADRTRTGYMMEHRLVMARQLGRRLLPGENVHHKRPNSKADNSPGNLELWITVQPSGQRVEDVVEWATEMLGRYAPERLMDASRCRTAS